MNLPCGREESVGDLELCFYTVKIDIYIKVDVVTNFQLTSLIVGCFTTTADEKQWDCLNLKYYDDALVLLKMVCVFLNIKLSELYVTFADSQKKNNETK